ncbi:MAG: tyrosine-type recombinase/integrase, partial [Thermoanaerobaculia bacterium]|nr:tyrosine-type recombinase/integrase [Thermoanaerobaculia bacterium]
PRDRVLTATEVGRLWQVCSQPPASLTSLLLQLRLVTAQRGAQLRSMKTCQLERNALGLWWNVPSEITKSGKPNRVYLSPLAEEVLSTAQPSADGWIFGQAPPKAYFSGSKEALRRIRRAVGGRGDWRGMDLRRTATTWMAQRGVTRFIVKRVLGHTDREITAVYDLYTYDQEVKYAVLILEQAVREAIGRPTVATSTETVAADGLAVAEGDAPSFLDL